MICQTHIAKSDADKVPFKAFLSGTFAGFRELINFLNANKTKTLYLAFVSPAHWTVKEIKVSGRNQIIQNNEAINVINVRFI